MKRLLLAISLLFCLIALAAAGVYGLREQLLAPPLLAALNGQLAPITGIELTVERISGNYYNRLELHNIRSRPLPRRGAGPSPPTSEARLEINLASARLDYSLAALRHGLDPFLATLQIHLADGDLALNLNAPPPPAAGRADKQPDGPPTLPLLPSISGQKLNLSLLYHELRLSGQDIQFTIQQDSRPPSSSVSLSPSLSTPAFTLSLQSPLVGLEHPRLVPLQAPLQLKLRSDRQSATLETLQLGELLNVERARLEYGEGSDAAAWHLTLDLRALGGKLNLDASGSPDPAASTRPTELTITDLDLARLAALTTALPDRLVPLAPIEGLLDLKAQVEFTPQRPFLSDPTGSLTLHLRQAALAGETLDDLELTARLEQGLLHLEQLAARLGDNRLNVRGLTLTLADLSADDLTRLPTRIGIEQFSADFSDLPALWALTGQPPPPLVDPGGSAITHPRSYPAHARDTRSTVPHRLTFTGALQNGILQLNRAELDAGPAGHLSLAKATIGPRPESGDYQELPLAGSLQLQIADLEQVSALLGLPPLAGSLTAALEFAGTPNAPGGQGKIMATNLLLHELLLDHVDGEVEFSPRRLTITGLKVQSGADGLKAQGAFALPSPHLFRQADMAAWFSQLRGEDFQIELTLTDMGRYRELLPSSWRQPQFGGGLNLKITGSGGTNLESLRMQGSLVLQDGRWGQYRGHELTADLAWRDHRLLISDAALESRHGRAWLSGEIGGLGSRKIEIELSDLGLQNDDLELALLEPARFALSDNRLSLATLKLGGPTASLTLSGGYQSQPSGPESGPELDLQGSLRSDDLAWLAPLIGGVRRIEGEGEVEFRLSGAVAAPQLSGSIALENGGLRFFGDTPALRELSIKAEFERNRLQFQHFSGLLGGAPFTIKGTITSAPEQLRDLEQLELDLTLAGRDILFYRDEGIRVRGNGELNFKGPLAGLLVSGEILITDGLYSKNVDFLEIFRGSGSGGRQAKLELFSFNSPPWRDLNFQIRLQTATSFLVANNLARGSLRPVLMLGGSGELPVLTGEIYLDPIRITLPSGRLNVEGGLIRFPVADPDRPTFDLTATSRLAGYDIHLALQGSADDPVLTLSSVPPLADDELLLLLLTGRPPTLSGEAAQRRAGMNLAVFLGRNLLDRLLSGQETETDERVLERFELEMGRAISRSGQETIEASFLLAEDLLSRDERILITSERDIYDDFNVGLKIVFRRP